MKLLPFLTVLLTAAIPCMAVPGNAVNPSAKPGKTARPNIIFILVDDMGWGDLDSNWSQENLNGRTVGRKNEFKTPALSAMAREGIQLRRHYSAAPVCAPARASLLLGVHQGTSRVVRNNRFDHPIEDSHTLGSVLKEAGYDTAAIGKWGVGGGGQSNGPVTGGPHQRGFNYFYGILDHLAGHFHYPSESRDIFEYNGYAPNPEWKNIKEQVPLTAYSTDLFGARAKQWTMDQRKSARKTGKPFFLYLAFPAPHGSLTVPGTPYPSGGGVKGGLQWVKKNGTESANTAFDPKAEKDKDTYIYPDNSRFPNEVAKRHSTMIRRVDDVVADLIHLLKDLKIDNNTMIVFTSDNGPHNEGGADMKHQHGAQNPQFFKSYGMMDGIKRDCWEGGMRVPTLVRWPARIPKGQVSLQPGQFHDWLATLADAAGVPVPARSDGVSLMPTLTGHADKQKPGIVYTEYNHGGKTPGYKDFLGEHKGAQRGQQQIVFVDGLKGLRMGVKDADKDFMIFDTLKDPQESKDLAASKPELQARMKAASLSNRRASHPSKTVFDTALVPAVEAKGVPGLKWSLYEGEFPWVPDFRQMKTPAVSQGVTQAPSVKMNGPRKRGVELTGYVNVPEDGAYTFYLTTDANKGSKAFVRLHGMELIDADKVYHPGTEVSSDLGKESNPVYLKAGLHPIRIGYVGTAGSGSTLTLKWKGPNLPKQEIPVSAFSHSPDGK